MQGINSVLQKFYLCKVKNFSFFQVIDPEKRRSFLALLHDGCAILLRVLCGFNLLNEIMHGCAKLLLDIALPNNKDIPAYCGQFFGM